MSLFDPARHEPLIDVAWDELRARRAIEKIVGDVHGAFAGIDGLWPIHPIDRSPERADVLKPIYYGAAGVIWALRYLHDGGAASLDRDYRPALSTLLERHRADSASLYGSPVLGYPVGDAGILLLEWQLMPSDAIARELRAVIEGNANHPSLGFVWGGAGSMLAALFMFEQTHDEEWKALYLRMFDGIWSRWSYDAALGCHLWTQDLYGAREQRIGGLHGFAGMASCLLRGASLLPSERREALIARTRRTLMATALRDGREANWPMSVGATSGPGNDVLRVQHCVGAPGMVNCLDALPMDPDTDALLLGAGELTWRAGPVAKLPSLCHGTPGSGYAFLKLFLRTGDEMWLMRARRFAMHAIEQAERGVAEHRQRKFSLWTGDLGLAIYLWDCVRATARFPTLDVFFQVR